MGIMVMDKNERILLGLRNDDVVKASSELHGEGTWTMPGGKKVLNWGMIYYQVQHVNLKRKNRYLL